MKKEIIYVDDDEVNLTLFELQISKYYDVTLSSDPVAAVDIIKEKSIPVVITDFMMPKLNGMELVRKVKTVNPKTVCIMVSAFSHIQELDMSLIFDFVNKPYDIETIIGVIENGYNVQQNIRLENAS